MAPTSSVPTFVTLSEELEPVSLVKATVGASAVVSSVNVNSVASEASRMPSGSTCRTETVFGPSTAVNESVQKLPSSEYWTRLSDAALVADTDSLPVPAREMTPTFEILSDNVAPVSFPLSVTRLTVSGSSTLSTVIVSAFS